MDKDVLKKSMLCEAFKGAIENENLKEAFARAFITSLCYYKTDKKIEMSIECCDCVGPDQIKGLERAISKHLKTKVKIYPGFPSTLNGSFEKWQKELVFSRVKSEKTHFHHFLEGAEFDLSGRYLSIKLKTQASAILNAAGVGKSIETAIQRLFDKDVSVSFIDSTENEKNVDYMARKQEMEARLIAEAMAAVPVNGRNGDDWHVPEPPPLDEPPVRYRTKKTKNIEKDPDLIFGKGIKGQVIKMSQVDTNSGQVTIQGRILKTEQRQLKTGRTLFTFDITDMTSSLTCKIFVSDKELEIISGKLVKDQHVCLSGEAQYDMYAKELVVLARDIRLVDMETEARMDLAPQKRVELHLHTQMSQLDAICGTKELIKRAAKWGHKAIAITDHGVVQAFPEAQDTANELKKKQKKDIKIIYGVEAYFIADEKYNSKGEVDYRHCDTYHAVILVKNQTGLKNLYRIVSESHLNYFYKRPRIPKSLFEKYREGLLIGSACEAGELFQAVYKGFPEEETERIASYYDYLEIQPIGNNQFMIRQGDVSDEEDLKNLNKRIIELGEKLNKPVVATCDVHFMDPDDTIYREILQAGQGYKDAEYQAPVYLRTTEEMLKEFAYLGEEKAYEVVVTNTNLIADMIEFVEPIPSGTFPPRIEGAEEDIEKLTSEKVRELYGDPLPGLVQERVDRELSSIIKNGFSVMYIIAQKLVKKSLEDGYLVGSRGSVGSSFVAYLIGITEVNSLPSHYRCGKCKYSEFFDKDASIGCGFDLPDKNCPVCGEPLTKDGYNIPFETFLGFDGDKEPDIDLNFSGEYQSRAHKYTEEIFGEGYTFRAGTIATIADKTAYGFVKNYLDEKQVVATRAEIERLAAGCTGIKRTTGQHPGGVMIVPHYKDIYDFTPIQRPADDTGSDIITTHFDYHSIGGRILKLDILGHDDPTVIRMLEDLTGVDAKTIPIGEKKTMGIFSGTEPLGVSPEEINSQVGTLGVPEFGTKFVRQMLIDTKPTTFAELIRISGLSHGTDVWLNNAQELVREGVTTLSNVICTRDDIMIYLIQHGLPDLDSFKIMESVRRGKGLSPEQEELMKANNIPKWYIDSCKKIKYMFPKAHAAAYVMMAFRIAWFKVYYPKAFYAAYFSVRADTFDANIVSKGLDAIKRAIEEIERKGKDATNKDKDMHTILEVAQEMYARGIKCLPVDLYKSDATRFLVTDEGILPPFTALQGLGMAAANNIVEARKTAGDFISIEELKVKAGISKAVIEILEDHGCLEGLDQSSQMSLF
ncbi:MAG: PolC-type DNA polymerase III [Clostridiaceae bacterium]|jgi:DNA polymerase-3 subunit alpha (Gram-positive type)|nr:PolC-type DNA polymerase III [Clostridiaceae bacterium]